MPANSYAHAQAKIALAFLRDCAAAGQLDPCQPVFLIETQAASGWFGYSVHRHLRTILEESSLAALRVKLILTDPDLARRTPWIEHPRLKPLAQTGLFDLANPDFAHDDKLRMELSGQTFSSGKAGENSFVNPVIVVAPREADLKGLRRICGDRLLVLFREPVEPETAADAAEIDASLPSAGDCRAISLVPGVDLKETLLAVEEASKGYGSAGFEASESPENLTIQQYLVLLRLYDYDAATACAHADHISALIVQEGDDLRADLKSQLQLSLRKVWDGYFSAGETEDIPLALASVAVALHDWELAFELLDASLTLRGESGPRAFLVALSHVRRKEVLPAAKFLEIALKSNPQQEEYLWLRQVVQDLLATEYDSVLAEIYGKDLSSADYRFAAELLDELIAPNGYPPPERDPGPLKRLTIGIQAFDDLDGVLFSVLAIRVVHPEITDRTEILVIDNQPEGKAAEALKSLSNWAKNYRYVAAPRPGGTAAIDLVFRHANAEFVLCIDSHVLFKPGSLAALLDYLEAHPNTPDLLQGPAESSSHAAGAIRFEIHGRGLNLFACRRDAWPGLNPRFRGFGGQEDYLHEKFRRAGAATLCLPFLRWAHNVLRPGGAQEAPAYRDHIRNYLLGFQELLLDPEPAIRRFEALAGTAGTREVMAAVKREIENPFHFFDGIYCVNLNGAEQRWEHAMEQCRRVGIDHLVLRFAAVETPHNHHIGCALSHRAIIAEAKRRRLCNVLILEDDVVFAPDTLEILRKSLSELASLKDPWRLLYLGGLRHRERFDAGIRDGEGFEKVPGCHHLEAAQVTNTHAWAVSETAYDVLLQELPDTPTAMAAWLWKPWYGFDWYLMERFAGSSLLVSPIIAEQLELLPYATRSFDWGGMTRTANSANPVEKVATH